jgi:molybdenum-dependent DNA-binding transcriptional regulator ModE
MPEQNDTSIAELKAFLKREAMRPVRSIGPRATQHVRLRQLEIFNEAARHSTFVEAAHGLGVTKVYLGETIDSLEENLGGVQLRERGTMYVELTPAGKALVEKADGLLRDEADTRAAFAQFGPAEGNATRRGANEPERELHLKLRQIEVFLEAAQHENLLAASRVLGLSTSYMSDTIANLEEELGDVRLFDRDAGGSRLTPAGKLLVERGRQLLDDEEAIRTTVAGAAPDKAPAQPRGPVSVRYQRSARNALAAVEFLEDHAPAGRDLRFPSPLTRALVSALGEIGHAGESVDRTAAVLDVMQASVTDSANLEAIFEPSGRASRTFRDLHQASEQQTGAGAAIPRTRRGR